MSRDYLADVPEHEVTPPEVFFGRRQFITAMALGILGGPRAFSMSTPSVSLLEPPFRRPEVFPAKPNEAYTVPAGVERKDLTPREEAAAHNNFYEFLPGRGGPVWRLVDEFEVEPWKVEVTGECNKPLTLDLDDLFAFPQEERVYHFRCVERWAMNVPWTGFPLRKLLEKVEPKSSARFVRFVSAERRGQMPGLNHGYYPWPYHEGLRMDEAMNELALVVTGVYGEPLLKQHGAPVRIIVPWKYGYKNPKSIVKVELTKSEPKTFWQSQQPEEYGFLSNVNPNIPHPRWSQSESYWLDTRDSFPTPLFNGYEKFVAELYPDEPRTPQEPLVPGQKAR